MPTEKVNESHLVSFSCSRLGTGTAQFVKKHRSRDGSFQFGFFNQKDIEHGLRDRRRHATKRYLNDLDFYISSLNTKIKEVSIAEQEVHLSKTTGQKT